MKALTLHQPWASLVALGIKTIETRSWRTNYRGWIAIHAGLALPKEGDAVGAWTVERWRDEPGRACMVLDDDHNVAYDLPLGAVVATARLVACVPIYYLGQLLYEGFEAEFPNVQRNGDVLSYVPKGSIHGGDFSDQLAYGDFRPGRWAWILQDIAPTAERCPVCLCTFDPCRWCLDGDRTVDPIPAKGKQGLWEWTP